MHFDEIARGQLLIIDSRETDARILWEILSQAGYTNIRTAAGLRAAIDMVQNGFQPDLVILDLEALNAEGLGPLRDLQRRISQDSYVPLLAVVTGPDFGLKERAMLLLARDYITRPFDRTEVLFRVKNLLETRLLYLAGSAPESGPRGAGPPANPGTGGRPARDPRAAGPGRRVPG
jgi:PleD family two-component response regulator